MPTSEHFSESELTCHHCGQGIELISPRLLELLEQLRENTGGLPLSISNAYRCPEHNAEVGGADVLRPEHLSLGELKWYCEQLPFDAIGYYPEGDFIHVDVRYGGICEGDKIGERVYWDGP